MTNRTPLLLALFCLISGFLIFFSERQWHSTDEKKLQAKRLFEIEPDLVERITIRSPAEDIKLEKKKEKWWLQEPLNYLANEERVKSLLNDLKYLEAIELFQVKNPEKELEKYGLKNPRFVLRANWGKEQIELRVGRETAFTNAVYAQFQKGVSEVRVIDRAIVDKLAQNFNNWRDRQVLSFDPNTVTKIILRNAVKEMELQKKKGEWYVIRPLYARASNQHISTLLQKLQEAQVESFVSEDKSNVSAWGLSEPQLRVQLFNAEKKERVATLQLGNIKTDDLSVLFARRGGEATVFTLSTNVLEFLSLSTESYRDKKLARFSPEKVSRIRLYQNGILTHHVFQTNGIWFSTQDNLSHQLNASALNSFLSRLSELEVYHFVEDTSANLEPYGLLVPTLRLELEFQDQTKMMALSLGKTKDMEKFAYLEQEPFVVSVLEKHIDFLNVTAWDWENLTVTKSNPQTITQFEIKRNNVISSYQRKGEIWLNAAEKPVDSVGAEAVVNLVSNLRAKKWLGTNLITNGEPDWCFRYFTPEPKELKLWNQEGRTIGFFEGMKDWFFELEKGDAVLAQQPLETNHYTNITNSATEP